MEAYHFIGPVLAALTALLLGGMALAGVRMWARRARGLTEKEMTEIRGRLREQISEEVSQALADRDAEIEELHERLEFAERVLTLGRARRPPRHDDAEMNTPG